MYDMNFFTPFQNGRKPKQKGGWIKVITFLLVVLLIAAPMTMFIMLSKVNNDISNIQGVLRLPKNKALINELETKIESVNNTELTFNTLQKQAKYVNTENWLNEELLRIVIDTMPKQVRFTSLELTQFDPKIEGAAVMNGFSITGVAGDKPAIAEIEYNLRNTGLFDNIFVFTIVDSEGNLQFDLQFSVKGGAKP